MNPEVWSHQQSSLVRLQKINKPPWLNKAFTVTSQYIPHALMNSWHTIRGKTNERYRKEAPLSNFQKLVICWAIFLAAGISSGNFERWTCKWSSFNAYFFYWGHMQCLKLVFTCSALCSCKLKLWSCAWWKSLLASVSRYPLKIGHIYLLSLSKIGHI